MSWFWDSLTWQGKLLAFVGVLVLFGLLGLTFGRKTEGQNTARPLVLQPTVQAAVPFSSPTVSAVQPLGTQQAPQPGGSPPAVAPLGTPASASPTATLPALSPTATPLPPTAVATAEPPTPRPTLPPATPTLPPPPPATATPSGCSVSVSLSNPSPASGSTETISAKLACGGSTPSGSVMTATAYFKAQANCGGISDAGGQASCGVTVPAGSSGTAVSVNVCFISDQLYCKAASFTPQ